MGSELSEEAAAWLQGDDSGWFGLLEPAETLRELWLEYGDHVVEQWVELHPGAPAGPLVEL
jgi:hypothetical protein